MSTFSFNRDGSYIIKIEIMTVDKYENDIGFGQISSEFVEMEEYR
jgi:hypothetical protein